ncbi:MAG: hypothetical protein KAW93_01150 [Methanogenium sp.]|nr:hypothetical protein [Methanogenium sp.]
MLLMSMVMVPAAGAYQTRNYEFDCGDGVNTKSPGEYASLEQLPNTFGISSI